MSFITEVTASQEAVVSSDLHPGEPEEGNPFMPMSRSAVRAVVGFGALYALMVCAMGLFHAAEGEISMVMVALSSAWLIFWTFPPLFFLQAFLRLVPSTDRADAAEGRI